MGQKLSEPNTSASKNMEEKRENEIEISVESIHCRVGLPSIASTPGSGDEDNSSNEDPTCPLNRHFEHLYNNSENTEGRSSARDENNGLHGVKPSTSAELDEAHCSNYCPNSAQRQENLKLFPPSSDSRKNKSRRKKSQKKEGSGRDKKKRAHWVLRFNCARLKSGSGSSGGSSEPEVTEPIPSCICSGCRRTKDDHHLSTGVVLEARQRRDSTASSDSDHQTHHFIDFTNRLRYREDVAQEDCDERARIERAREIAEGMDPPPGFRPRQHIQLVYSQDMICLDSLTVLLHSAALSALSQLDAPNVVHTQVDYIHCLVPDLLQITSCSFYWGKMDRYEAERLLEGKPEGTFLLRDSAQEEHLFSVSFRRYGRSLHARIEQWKHMFSFDSHDPGVYQSPTVCGLLEHYKDPSCCMFFEPVLTYPLHRNYSFPLQHLCRAVICSKISYDGIAQLRLPKSLKSYLKEYHYKQRVKVRVFDLE